MTRRDDAWMTSRLGAPPRSPRIVIDTDAANEIDDAYALAWALLSPRLQVEATYAAPFSFAHRRAEMLRAQAARGDAQAGAADRELLRRHRTRLDHFERQGWDVRTATPPPFEPPAAGMERSVEAIGAVLRALGRPVEHVYRGSTGYLQRAGEALRSDAALHLIETALATPADGEPLYVVAIGCVTNVVSALLIAPEIAERIVVVWTAGFPSHAPHANDAFNLEQDLIASQTLFDCGVPHVYLPGYHVGAQLRLSIDEVERHVRGCGAIGAHLHHLYLHNPLAALTGVERPASWVMWDVVNIAWLLEPDWVPSTLVRSPRLGDDRHWQPGGAERHWMREAWAVERDAIFGDFFARLAQAPNAASTAQSSVHTASITGADR
jgi:purine nucleosidase